ncbi:MAG: ComEC family competence protein [Candidatus Omnitrophica bacterium]|nr:ComEC family competence protein [Candidatus Omnitrophota bacterium]
MGIIIGTYIPNAFPVLICLLSVFFLLLSGFFALKKYFLIRPLILYTSLLLFSISYTNSCFYIANSDIGKVENKPVILTGLIISEPEIEKWQTNLIIKIDTIKFSDSVKEEVNLKGCRVLAQVKFSKKDIFYGEKYKLSGVLRIPKDEKFTRYLKGQKIAATININDRKKIQYIGEGKVNPLIKISLKLKKVLTDNLKAYVSPNYSPLLGAMMFKSGVIPRQIREMFAKIGVAHVLAISGLHVVIISGIFLIIFKLLNIPKRISFSFTFILIIIYVFVTGLRVPVIRAGLMVNLFLLGYIIRRKTDIFIALATACLLILLWNPYSLFEAGFQLSFITILSIVLITPRLENFFNLPVVIYRKQKGRQPIWPSLFFRNSLLITSKIFLVSVAAWLGSLPLVVYYFGYISWISPVSNLFVIPLVTLILASGCVLLFSILVFPFSSPFFAAVVNFLLFLLLKISEIISSWSFVQSEIPKLDLKIVFIYYLAVFLFIYYPKGKELIKGLKNGNSSN